MGFHDLVKHIQHVTTPPRIFTNEIYDVWINRYIELKDSGISKEALDKIVPPNIQRRVDAYLELRGDGPYPLPRDIKDWFNLFYKENKWFVEHFTKLSSGGDFCDDFNTDFY